MKIIRTTTIELKVSKKLLKEYEDDYVYMKSKSPSKEELKQFIIDSLDDDWCEEDFMFHGSKRTINTTIVDD